MKKILTFAVAAMLLFVAAQTVQRYAVVADGIVQNIIVWDGKAAYNPDNPDTSSREQLVLLPDNSPVGIRWLASYNSSTRRWTFTRPPDMESGEN